MLGRTYQRAALYTYITLDTQVTIRLGSARQSFFALVPFIKMASAETPSRFVKLISQEGHVVRPCVAHALPAEIFHVYHIVNIDPFVFCISSLLTVNVQ